MALKVKSPVSFFHLFMYGVICMALGGLISFFVMTNYEVSKLQQTSNQMILEVENMVELREYIKEFKQLTDDRFLETDGQVRRLTHIMRVKPAERIEAAERYDNLEDLQ